MGKRGGQLVVATFAASTGDSRLHADAQPHDQRNDHEVGVAAQTHARQRGLAE